MSCASTWRAWGRTATSRSRPSSPPRPGATGRCRHPAAPARRDAAGDDRRLRAALPALDGPAPQGRPAHRLLPPADRRPPRRRAHPGGAGELRHAHRRRRRPAISGPSWRTGLPVLRDPPGGGPGRRPGRPGRPRRGGARRVTATARPPRAGTGRATGRTPNALRAGLRLEKVPDPCSVVIFGGTGDLSHRKILPALYNLTRAGLLPAEQTVVGFARRPYTDDVYRAEMAESVAEFSRVPVEKALWHDFALGHLLPGGRLHRPGRLRGPRRAAGGARRGARHARQPPLLPGRSPQRLQRHHHPPGRAPVWPGRAAAAGSASSSRSPSGATWPRRATLNREVTHVFDESRRSTASTTTWARRPSRTCWSSASATASSSRSGTAATSTTCRSPWPRTWAWRVAAQFYEEAGASRDILQNHLLQLPAWSPWSRPSPSRPTRCATRSCGSCAPSTRRGTPRRIRRDVVRGPVRRGLGGRRPRAGLPRGAGGGARPRRPRPTWPSSWRSRTGAGPTCPSTCAPASGCPSGRPRSRSSSSGRP